MIQPNTVITGDSLTVLRSMDDESVDMVITDPPYGIDYQSGRPDPRPLCRQRLHARRCRQNRAPVHRDRDR